MHKENWRKASESGISKSSISIFFRRWYNGSLIPLLHRIWGGCSSTLGAPNPNNLQQWRLQDFQGGAKAKSCVRKAHCERVDQREPLRGWGPGPAREIVFPTAVPDPPSDFNYHHSGIFSDGINARVRTGVRNCSGINNLAPRPRALNWRGTGAKPLPEDQWAEPLGAFEILAS